MASREEIDQSAKEPDEFEGLSDEEILAKLERDARGVDGPDENSRAQLARIGLDLLKKGSSDSPHPSFGNDPLREALGDELADKLLAESGGRLPGQYGRGTVIAGRYRLVSLIGEGGMGSVWVAEQKEPVRRRVALKLVKPGMDSRQVLHRFESERQALAAMDHPNIARILDGGLTEHHHPFFAMELVNGASLTRFCDEARLGISDRLELFTQIAQAIQHAHHKGILHRDLKPSNILVTVIDGKPVPKVIDFGLAKVLGSQVRPDSMVTGFGAVVGTLEYMAPEQAGFSGQDVDTRADIYSLGVILYELLTGLRPFDPDRLASAAFDEMVKIIREEDPMRPSVRLASSESATASAQLRQIEPARLSGILRNELDWIVMKALEKDRNRRYETANSLAEDVRHYLSGEPVLAHPPTVMYRLRKFTRRHRIRVMIGCLVVFAFLCGIGGLVVGLLEAKRQEGIAVREAREKGKALHAEQAARKAEGVAREHALTALRAMTDEFIQGELARESRMSRKERSYLRNIIRQFDAFASFSADDAENESIRAEGRYRVGIIYAYLGEHREAEIELRTALDTWNRLVQQLPDKVEYARWQARAQYAMAGSMIELGWIDDARKNLDLAYQYWEGISERSPSEANLSSLANCGRRIGQLLNKTGRFREAETVLRETVEIWREIARRFPKPDNRQTLASTLNSLAGACSKNGKEDEASKLREESMSIRKQVARRYSARPDFAYGLTRSYGSAGSSAMRDGDLEEAASAYQEATRILRELCQQYPSKPLYEEALADALKNMAQVFEKQGRGRDSFATLTEAIDIRQRLVSQFPEQPEKQTDLASLQNSLGNTCRDLNMLEEAESVWRRSIELREIQAEKFPDNLDNRTEMARSLQSLASFLDSTDRTPEAIRLCERAVSIRRECIKQDPTRLPLKRGLASALQDLGGLLVDTPRSDEAEPVALEALAMREALFESEPSTVSRAELIHCLIELGNICLKRNDFLSAGEYFGDATVLDCQAVVDDSSLQAVRGAHVRLQFFLIQLNASDANTDRAIEVAKRLSEIGWNPGENAYYAACGLARCLPLVSGYPGLEAGQKAALATQYSDAALNYLRDAIAKGYDDRAVLEKDADLDPLRNREEFRRILETIPRSSDR
jgi:eukaryotic-like serine/threonine-protein kinase